MRYIPMISHQKELVKEVIKWNVMRFDRSAH